jgi:UDP-N-acetylmuramoylalanine--D-glutamate ligase
MEIEAALGFERSCYVSGFEEAVRCAVEATEAGDTLLLSPACTSWDQFESYEVRGAVFQAIATSLLSRRQGRCGT